MGIIELLLKPLATSRSTARYPAQAAPVRATRTPRFDPLKCTDERMCEAACPTSAITIDPGPAHKRRWALDYGKCVFCAECIRVCPSGAIAATADFHLSARVRTGVTAEYWLESTTRE